MDLNFPELIFEKKESSKNFFEELSSKNSFRIISLTSSCLASIRETGIP